jgi:hypothetical protein
MYRWIITCMGVTNISLNEELREALEETAVAMIHSGSDVGSFKSASAEGRIKKERDYVLFMYDGGPLFSAEIETELGLGKVRFIIPERHLQALADGWEKVESIHIDDAHMRRAANAIYN